MQYRIFITYVIVMLWHCFVIVTGCTLWLLPVMGKSQSLLGFKSQFEHFLGVIQQFKDSIRQLTTGIRLAIFCDLICVVRFDS